MRRLSSMEAQAKFPKHRGVRERNPQMAVDVDELERSRLSFCFRELSRRCIVYYVDDALSLSKLRSAHHKDGTGIATTHRAKAARPAVETLLKRRTTSSRSFCCPENSKSQCNHSPHRERSF
jgi:hypothetical protein